MQEELADLTLALCCELTPLAPDAMRMIDRSPIGVRAAVATIVFSKLPRKAKIDIATRVEKIEAAMRDCKV